VRWRQGFSVFLVAYLGFISFVQHRHVRCGQCPGAHAAGTVEALEICVFGWSGHVVVKPGWYTQVGGGATVPPLYDTR